MGSQGLMFSWLKSCFPWGKETTFANLGWRADLCSDTQLLCHSSGKVGNTLWFHYEMILTSVTELFHSPLLNVFEISSEKSSVDFSAVVFCISVPRCSTLTRAGCSSFSLQKHTVYKMFLRRFCCLWCSQWVSLDETIQTGRVEEKGR